MKISIRTKIIAGFIAIFLVGMTVGIYSLYAVNKLSEMSIAQSRLQDANENIFSILSTQQKWNQNLMMAVFTNAQFTGSFNPNTCALGEWKESDEALETANDEIKTLMSDITAPHIYIHEEAKHIIDLMEKGETKQAQEEFTKNVQPKSSEVDSILEKMTREYESTLKLHTAKAHNYQGTVQMTISIMLLLAIILCIVLSTLILKSIMKPLITLTKASDAVVSGDFDVELNYPVNDEIGRLTQALAALINTQKELISDISKMAEIHIGGDIEYFIDVERYSGEFKYTVIGINSMIKDYVDNVYMILGVVQKYAEGDFTAKIDPLPGKKALANKVLNTVAENLNDIKESVMLLVKAALGGELHNQVDDSGFKGDWKTIINSMNQLLAAVEAPIVETEKALLLVSEGKLDVKVSGSYKGQFKKMADSINKTIEILSMYINDISSTLYELASDNFDVFINRDYIGSFGDIKISLNAIINRLNNVMDEIGQASEQVAAGAGQISQTSVDLSQGTIEQASVVQQLNASLEAIYSETLKNADNTSNANDLASEARENAEQGNVEMKEMLKSMSEINTSSQNISKIIKVIDDIAFQTNLLALNAAVEAARAGMSGKGFAVVAEEVRDLAIRSKEAASETAAMIEQSISKVNEGTVIANNTAGALMKIVEGVENVSDIINKIEDSSRMQAESIAKVNEGIINISHVTQENSATSEESAAAAEELSSQSEMLKDMIMKFKLRG